MKRDRVPKKSKPDGENSMAGLFSNLRYSLPATLGIFLGLNLIVSLILYFLKDPAPYVLPLSYVVSAVTAFFGGYILCKKQKSSALFCGLVNGSLFLCLLLLISLFFRSYATGYGPLLSAALHIAFLALSVVGGYAGLPRVPSKHHKR
ncbi:MAG: TIGR04086 family membrane protein [Clostridia bacterium]|nr:TIGR04086 family membrane protein [Clostridia bacterium]